MPMAVSPDRRFLYAALRSEPYSIANFAIDAESGLLTFLGYAPAGESPVYICTDHTGRFLLAACNPPDKARRTGIVTVSAIGRHGFVQAPHQMMRTPPKAHAVLPAPSNRFVFASSCDGDVIVRYAFDAATGLINPDPLPPTPVLRKSGPRHFVFHPNNRFLYVLNEYDASICTFGYDARSGVLCEIQTSCALPPNPDNREVNARAADIHFTPDGRWLYASDRCSLNLSAFRVDALTGLLSPAGRFPTVDEPRSFGIDPFGRFLVAAGVLSKTLALYRIDSETGSLTRLADYETGEGPNWVEIVRLP
jgi:6-phosphogluconolactonase